MATASLSLRIIRGLARLSLRPRIYGSPRHLSDYMLKDIGITSDDLGHTRRR